MLGQKTVGIQDYTNGTSEPPQVPLKLEELRKASDQLSEELGRLIERLHPVMSQTPALGAKEAEGEELVPLANELAGIARGLRYLASILSDANRSIQL